MGDRCNVAIRVKNDPDPSKGHVWLYSHWGGHGMPNRVLSALQSREAQARLGDEAYACRILLDRLINEHTGETGYGVSLGICDNEYPIIEIDLPALKVRVRECLYNCVGGFKVEWAAPATFECAISEFIKKESFSWNNAEGREDEEGE